eukprot:TRINITY_DN1567_c0_g1_i2.p2 TRINITY_DN1567_c0_g1~~TRINITY_DN1567_c0_g1_i2.p2  ORF type:complete len:113 (+),score=54.92 TRINITY_DN1567_c0_g1_i2:74-412(+)
MQRFVTRFARVSSQIRCFSKSSGSGHNSFAEKESAIENQFFTQSDHAALLKIAEKLKRQAEAAAPATPAQAAAKAIPITPPTENTVLKDLLGRHGVKLTDALAHDLLRWKSA